MVWIQTFKRIQFDLEAPTADMVDLEDIAHALSLNCRWTGHVPFFFSVAEHSVMVSMMVEQLGGSLEEQRAALMHDAHEAYTGDISSPLKSLLAPQIHQLQGGIQAAIDEKFGLIETPAIVHKADSMALDYELTFLRGGPSARWTAEPEPMGDHWRKIGERMTEAGTLALPPIMAERLFLSRAKRLGF